MLVYQSDNSVQHEHMRVEFYKDFAFFPHLHRDLEFVLMLEGRVDSTVVGRHETISRGQIALVLSNQPHSFVHTVPSSCIVVNFSVGYVGAFMRAIEGKRGTSSVFTPSPALFEYLKSVYTLEPGKLPAPLAIKATCYAVCSEFLAAIPLEEAPGGNDQVLLLLLKYVEENYKSDISLKTAARAIGYDESYLSRYYHQSIDINFRRYINQHRVDYACQLLEKGEERLVDIALESGFQNTRSFNRAFLDCVGQTPSEYISAGKKRNNR